jgi:serine/threonine protein kinase
MITLDSAPEAEEKPPETIGPYRVVGVLGRGGMGVVYRAVHRDTHEVVALKTVSVPKRLRLLGIRAEILALHRLDHPQIVRIRDHGLSGRVPWYAMELLEGPTMAAWLVDLWPDRVYAGVTTSTASSTTDAPFPGPPTYSPGPLTDAPVRGSRPPAAAGRLNDVLRLFRMLCEPLSYLHARGIVHCDLKPSNVSLRADGRPVIMDFGLTARARGAVGREALDPGGHLVGTVVYLSPEQVRREVLDARTDLYALGCMLYEAVAGVVPFRGPTTEQVFAQHLYEPPLPLSTWVEGVDPRLEKLIFRLLAKERRERTGHADDVAHMLAEIEGDTSVHISETPGYLYRPEIVGRADVLEHFTALLGRLKDRRGGFVFLSGESGIGKTFLAADIARRAGISGLRVVVGECAPAVAPKPDSKSGLVESRGSPLQPLRPLLAAVADYCSEGGPERTARLLGARAAAMASYFPSLASVAGQDKTSEPVDLPVEEVHRRLVESFIDTLGAYADEGPPVLFLIDDLQWADELSVKVLAAIDPGWLANKGVLIVGIYRSDDTDKEGNLRELLSKKPSTSLTIDRMDAEAVGRIAADMLAVRSVPETLVRFLRKETEGVPFFVAEYLRAALSEGLLLRQGGRWRLKEGGLSEAELAALPLPTGIHGLMLRRLGGLEPDLRRLVNLASVIGREADLDLLARASGSPDDLAGLDQTMHRVRELVRLQILDSLEGGRYRFVHDKLREAAYGAIPLDERLELHREVARLLEDTLRDRKDAPPFGELGHHFTQGQLWDKAIDYLEKAGVQAVSTFAHKEALRYFQNAVTLAPKASVGVTRLRLASWERSLVESYLGTGNMPDAHAHAHLALNHCGFGLPTSRAGLLVAFIGQVMLRPLQRFFPWMFRVRSDERAALVGEAAYVLNRLCEPFFLAHRPLEGFYCGFRDLTLAARIPPSEALARGYATMAMVVGVGPFAGLGRTWSDRAISTARALGSPAAITYCLCRSGSALGPQGHWRDAFAQLAEGEAIARSRSDLRQLGEAVSTRALLHGFRGNFSDSLVAAEEVLAIGISRGDSQLCNWGRNLSVHALARLGRAREAIGIIQKMKEDYQSRDVGDAEKIFDYGGFALTSLALGDLADARRQASRVLVAIRREQFLPYFLKTGLDATSEVLLALLERTDGGSSEAAPLRLEAREMVGRLQKFASLYAMSRPRAHIYGGQLDWIDGKRTRALATWEKGLGVAEVLGLAVDLGRLHAEIARRLEPGRSAAGLDRDAHVAKARELLRAGGAAWELQRLEELEAARGTGSASRSATL